MRLKKIIPSWGQSLIDNADLCERIRADTASVLHLRTIAANP